MRLPPTLPSNPPLQYLDGISKASRKSLQDAGRSTTEGAEQQTRYTLALQQLSRLVAQREAAAAAAVAKLAPERARLTAAVAAADAQRAAFQRLVLDTAAAGSRAAAAGALRAAIPDPALQRFLAEEPAKAARGRALRAAAARLAHRLAAAERRLREADQLSCEGLHLVDFEQARIETATLTAKREARGAEVAKLRSKLVQTVQVGGGPGGCEGEAGALALVWEQGNVALLWQPAGPTAMFGDAMGGGMQPGVFRRRVPCQLPAAATLGGRQQCAPPSLIPARLPCRLPPT